MIHDVKPPLRTFLFVSSMLCFHAFFIVEATSIPGSCSLYGLWDEKASLRKELQRDKRGKGNSLARQEL